MAKKYTKNPNGTLSITNESTETVTEAELLQKKAGMEAEVAVLDAAIAEVDAQLEALG